VEFEAFERVWMTWAPEKCRFFIWLVAHKKCLTADRLARRGMDHPEKCPLCDQEEESIDHLLISCVFARKFWFSLFRRVHLQELDPHLDVASFIDWWQTVNELALRSRRKGLNHGFQVVRLIVINRPGRSLHLD
jgi:hypothetical protein